MAAKVDDNNFDVDDNDFDVPEAILSSVNKLFSILMKSKKLASDQNHVQTLSQLRDGQVLMHLILMDSNHDLVNCQELIGIMLSSEYDDPFFSLAQRMLECDDKQLVSILVLVMDLIFEKLKKRMRDKVENEMHVIRHHLIDCIDVCMQIIGYQPMNHLQINHQSMIDITSREDSQQKVVDANDSVDGIRIDDENKEMTAQKEVNVEKEANYFEMRCDKNKENDSPFHPTDDHNNETYSQTNGKNEDVVQNEQDLEENQSNDEKKENNSQSNQKCTHHQYVHVNNGENINGNQVNVNQTTGNKENNMENHGLDEEKVVESQTNHIQMNADEALLEKMFNESDDEMLSKSEIEGLIDSIDVDETIFNVVKEDDNNNGINYDNNRGDDGSQGALFGRLMASLFNFSLCCFLLFSNINSVS